MYIHQSEPLYQLSEYCRLAGEPSFSVTGGGSGSKRETSSVGCSFSVTGVEIFNLSFIFLLRLCALLILLFFMLKDRCSPPWVISRKDCFCDWKVVPLDRKITSSTNSHHPTKLEHVCVLFWCHARNLCIAHFPPPDARSIFCKRFEYSFLLIDLPFFLFQRLLSFACFSPCNRSQSLSFSCLSLAFLSLSCSLRFSHPDACAMFNESSVVYNQKKNSVGRAASRVAASFLLALSRHRLGATRCRSLGGPRSGAR